jgi:hypothetical protein
MQQDAKIHYVSDVDLTWLEHLTVSLRSVGSYAEFCMIHGKEEVKRVK